VLFTSERKKGCVGEQTWVKPNKVPRFKLYANARLKAAHLIFFLFLSAHRFSFIYILLRHTSAIVWTCFGGIKGGRRSSIVGAAKIIIYGVKLPVGSFKANRKFNNHHVFKLHSLDILRNWAISFKKNKLYTFCILKELKKSIGEFLWVWFGHFRRDFEV